VPRKVLTLWGSAVNAVVKKARSRVDQSRKLPRANNAPQLMRARKIEAVILEKMPANKWLSCTAVARLIGADDERKTRSRLDRLVRDGKLSCKRDQGTHGLVYLFCKVR
jgi:hypothetical protein